MHYANFRILSLNVIFITYTVSRDIVLNSVDKTELSLHS